MSCHFLLARWLVGFGVNSKRPILSLEHAVLGGMFGSVFLFFLLRGWSACLASVNEVLVRIDVCVYARDAGTHATFRAGRGFELGTDSCWLRLEP